MATPKNLAIFGRFLYFHGNYFLHIYIYMSYQGTWYLLIYNPHLINIMSSVYWTSMMFCWMVRQSNSGELCDSEPESWYHPQVGHWKFISVSTWRKLTASSGFCLLGKKKKHTDRSITVYQWLGSVLIWFNKEATSGTADIIGVTTWLNWW